MSIGLVIADISGSVRQPAAATGSERLAEVPAAAAAPTQTGQSVLNDPLSSQAALTPGFTVLVLELLNDKGAVVSTVPTAQQLAAYRNGTSTPAS